MQQSAVTESLAIQTVPVTTRKPRRARVPVAQAEVHRAKLQELLLGQDGKIVGLDFIKIDGRDRMLNGRLGVRKYLKGGDATIGFEDQPYLVMFDLQHKGYRAVNLATVSGVRARNTRYTVIG